ncbi:MAG TPA: DNA repair exonuclease [Polyangiaceae bacterium]|nr:DNA repair exonuclease [Polyangiaceae bacterium]
MKFVHAADLHIDSPLRGLERYQGAPVELIRGATRRALEHLVDLCLEEGAKLLVLAGDLYDGDWRDYSTGLFFCGQMARLREAEVEVVWIRGNHDAASRLTQHLHPTDNVRELSHTRAVTLEREIAGVPVAIHGQGYSKPKVTEDLADTYPAPVPGALNLGLLHTALDGREGHDAYAPCRVEALLNKGYDYWALGHVHQREEVRREPCWIVFPGNLQGRHARETGRKGASLVTVQSGRIAAVEHRVLDEVRWVHLVFDAGAAASADDVVDGVRDRLLSEIKDADGRLVAARVSVVGASRAHAALSVDTERFQNELRAAALDVGRDAAWIEKVVLSTRPEGDPVLLRARNDPLGGLLRALDKLRRDEGELSALCEELGELKRKLPRELLDGPDGARIGDAAGVRALLDDVESLLLPLLSEEASEP